MRCFSIVTIGTATAAALWVACGGAEILEADKPSSGNAPKKADAAVLPVKSPDAGARDPASHLVALDAGAQSSSEKKDAAPRRDGSARSDLVLQIPAGPTSLGGLGNLPTNGSLPDFSSVPGLGNLPGIGTLGGGLGAGGSAPLDGGAIQASGAGFPDLINNIPGAGNFAGGGGLQTNGDFTDLIKNIPGAGNLPGLDVLGNLVKNDAGP